MGRPRPFVSGSCQRRPRRRLRAAGTGRRPALDLAHSLPLLFIFLCTQTALREPPRSARSGARSLQCAAMRDANKEQADRCREIAEAALAAGDVEKAERFAQKALKLFAHDEVRSGGRCTPPGCSDWAGRAVEGRTLGAGGPSCPKGSASGSRAPSGRSRPNAGRSSPRSAATHTHTHRRRRRRLLTRLMPADRRRLPAWRVAPLLPDSLACRRACCWSRSGTRPSAPAAAAQAQAPPTGGTLADLRAWAAGPTCGNATRRRQPAAAAAPAAASGMSRPRTRTTR